MIRVNETVLYCYGVHLLHVQKNSSCHTRPRAASSDLEQLVLAAEPRVGEAESPLSVFLSDELSPLLGS